MKNSILFLSCLIALLALPAVSHAQATDPSLKDKYGDANAYGGDSAPAPRPRTPAPEPAPLPSPPPVAEPAPAPAPAASAPPPPPAAAAPAADIPAPIPAFVAVYQNYDFTPGDTIVFNDDFTATQDGEFPEQWELVKGQGIVNKVAGRSAFLLTEGNYVRVDPRVKTKSYLGPQYTVEFDMFMPPAGSFGVILFLINDKGEEGSVHVNGTEVQYANSNTFYLNAPMPTSIAGDSFRGQWHHVAIAVKNTQMKVYIDQFRVLTVPDMKNTFTRTEFGGIGDQQQPIIFSNLRVANGGGMNMIGQKFTEAKIVTHGINFDVDKSTFRPESMGTLNQIVRVLTENPDLKFEVDGHTDNSGAAAHNLTLSQQRAQAVKTQLVAMGIAPDRLTTKGFGDSKPIAPNTTQEGKANNRRVEFVRTTK
jgi:outer membrane protein OmpA-like peptidoglycan-associated protein